MLNLIRVAAVAAFLVLPLAVRAEQPAAAPAEAAMPCPHADQAGGCCGGQCAGMQGKAAAGAPAAAPAQGEEGGCPCQRAARAAAAAKAAAEHPPAQP